MTEGSPSAPLRVVAAGRTDVGRRRDHNEDNILLERELRLYVVADGMGGHNAGEVASALAARSLENFFAASESEGIPEAFGQGDGDLDLGARRLRAAVRKANADVFEIASTKKKHSGMGSTVVAAHVAEERQRIYICHVGDSRCYRMREGQIEQLTRDHSLVNDALAMRPDLSPEILAELPANVITRAVGTQAKVDVDIRTEPVAPGDLYLLCSDGLSGLVSSEQIAEVCGLTQDLDEMCELLVLMANEAGGSDNISAIALRIEPADDARSPIDTIESGSDEPDESVDVSIGEEEVELDVDVDEEEIDLDEPSREPAAAVVHDHADERHEALDAEAFTAEEESVAVELVRVIEPPAPEEPASEPPASADVEAELPAPGGVQVELPPPADVPVEPPASGDPAMAVCSRCGHEIVAEMTFCVECGTRIEATTAAVVPLSDLEGDDDAEPIEVDAEDQPAAAPSADEPGVDEAERAPDAEAATGESAPSSEADPGEPADEEWLEADCPSCGAPLIAGNLFCVECGGRIG